MSQNSIGILLEDNTLAESTWFNSVFEELPHAITASDTALLSLSLSTSTSSPQEVVEENLPRENAKKTTDYNLIPEHSSSNNSTELTSTLNRENPFPTATMQSQSVPSKILASNVADTSNSPRGVAVENLPREYAKKSTNHNLIPEHSSSNNIPSSSSPDLTSTPNLENPLPAATMEPPSELLASNVADTFKSPGGVAKENLQREHAKKTTNNNLIPEHSSSNNINSSPAPDLTRTPNLEDPLPAATMESESVPLEILTSNVADTSNSPGGVAEENLPREHAKKNTNNNLIPEHSSSNNIPSSSTSDSTSTPNLLPLFPAARRELESSLEISASHVGDTSKSPQGFAKENLLGGHAKETPAPNLLPLFPVPTAIDNISEGNREVESHVPFLGKPFPSMNDGYKFYQNYAAKMGFKVRRGKGQKSGNKIVKKTYLCSKEGHRAVKQNAKMTKYKRKVTRTGCNAQLQIALKNDEYEIVKFEAKHNHELQESTQRHCIDLDSEILEAETLNQPTHENEAAKTVEAGAHASPCDMNYSESLGHKNMNNLQSKDAQGLINYLKEDPSLFDRIQLDVECRVTNFFWSDRRSKIDYKYFGDVLILDTTFRMERYNMICAQFLGVNHHQETVLFGCAFLLDDSMESFNWLLGNFLKHMGLSHPKTIFTTECQAIMKAVKVILPKTEHRLCKQFVCQNAKQNLSKYYGQPGFESLFYRCLFDCEGNFQSMWDSLLQKYNLPENPWLQNICTLRTESSYLFNKRTFCAGLHSIHGSKKFSNVNFSQNSKSKPMTLPEYVQIYKEAAEQHRKKEEDEDNCCDAREPELISDSLMLQQASDKYTRTMFKIFQKNLLGIISVPSEVITSDEEIVEFKVTEGEEKENIVKFKISDSTTTCSCELFESVGILCVHALKVLNARNIFRIPQQHILTRWTKSARDRVKEDDNGKEITDESCKPSRKRKFERCYTD